MSPLTKAFVVLATILAVVMVTLTVAIVARVDDYAAKYKDVVASRDAAIEDITAERTAAAAAAAEKSDLAEGYEQDIKDLNAKLAAALDDDATAAQRVAQLEAEKATLVAAQEVNAANIAALGDRVERQSAAITAAVTEVGETATRLSETTQSLQTTAATLRRTENDLNRVREQNVALEQQLAEQAAINEELMRNQGIQVVDVVPDVDGEVTRVDESAGITLVQVNIGTRDGVRDNMEFTVYRGDEFIGTIQMKNVDTAAAVGQLTLATGSAVRAGDRVQTSR